MLHGQGRGLLGHGRKRDFSAESVKQVILENCSFDARAGAICIRHIRELCLARNSNSKSNSRAAPQSTAEAEHNDNELELENVYLSDIAQRHDRVNMVKMLVARIEGESDSKAAEVQREFPLH